MTDETGAPVNEAEQTEAETPAEPTIDADTATEADAAPEADPETLAVPVTELRPSLEAILMVADQPLDLVTLASSVGYRVEETGQALAGLAAEYDEQGRGFELRNVAGGWRFYTRDEFAAVVEAFVLEGQQARLTQAALETLAVVAYKQPVSRARVSAIRGVNVDGVMRTLLTRGLVEEAGQDGETGANLYRTTTYFLERIGVTDITDLPELAPFLPDMADMEDDLAALAGGSDEAVAAVAVETSGEAPGDQVATDQTLPADTTAASDEPVRP
ncbi:MULTISPECIES: SMC-Scp complex subunit ScpB [unclassified Nocardioides]|uniref:SMC-Scp complex subunit ScpB n=1 Tax=unclassified Nocardioides TaxID=2615069 RepID=UPI0009EA32E0|nr:MULTISPECIES: SMC-Scp complex subunit ScpB [unclassified Nocardioides]